MKKLLILLGLLSSSSVVEASVISSNSPWGACIWDLYEAADSGTRLLDLTVSTGISWVRLTGSADNKYNTVRDSPVDFYDGPETPASFFARKDAYVIELSKHNLNALAQWYPASTVNNIDSLNPRALNPRNHTTWRKAEQNWTTWWTAIVSHYKDGISDGNGEKTKPIKYWNICCEPYSGNGAWRIDWSAERIDSPSILCSPNPIDVSLYDSVMYKMDIRDIATDSNVNTGNWEVEPLAYIINQAAWDTIYTDITSFLYDYIRTSIDAILAADTGATIIIPSFQFSGSNSSCEWYVRLKLSRGTYPVAMLFVTKGDFLRNHQAREIMDSCVTSLNIAKHVVFDNHYKTINDLMYLKTAWKGFLIPKGWPERPVWLTELGNLNGDSSVTTYSNIYTSWTTSDSFNKTTDKLFPFCWNKQNNEATGLLHSNYSPTLVAMWLQGFIHGYFASGDIPDLSAVSDNEWFMSDASSATSFNNGRKFLVDAGGRVHCVFTSWHDEIMYAEKAYGATTWTKKYVIGEGKEPSIATDNAGSICITWTDGKSIFYRYRNIDINQTWSGIYTSPTYNVAETPCIAIDSYNNAHLVWKAENSGVYYIYYTTFQATSPNFNNIEPVFSDNVNDDLRPSITISSRFPHICWTKGFDLWYTYKDDFGWHSEDFLLAWAKPNTIPCIDIQNGGVHVVWERNDGEIYHKSAGILSFMELNPPHRNGETVVWKLSDLISTRGGYNSVGIASEQPVITAGSQILWREYSQYGYRIFGSHLDWSGNWTDPMEMTSGIETRGDESYPQACVEKSAKNLHFIYTYGGYSPYDIKYRLIPDVYIPSTYILVTSPANYDSTKWRIGYNMPIVWHSSDTSGVTSQEVWLADTMGTDIQKIQTVGAIDTSYIWKVDASAGNYKVKIKAVDVTDSSLGAGLSETFTATNEVIFNPSFEESLRCWTPYGIGTVDTSNDAEQGSYSAHISRVTGQDTNWFGLYQNNIPCIPNTYYYLSWYAKVQADSGKAVVGVGNFSNDTLHNDNYISNTNGWQPFYQQWYSKNFNSFEIKLSGTGKSTNTNTFIGNVRFDNLQLTTPMVSAAKEMTAYNNQRKLVVDNSGNLNLVWEQNGDGLLIISLTVMMILMYDNGDGEAGSCCGT